MKHTPMTQERLDAIRERVDASTAGPWQWWGEAELVSLSVPDSTSEDDYPRITNEDGQIDSSDDADLIEHAPDDLADLLAEVERLRARLTVDDDMVERAARASYGPVAWGRLLEAGDDPTSIAATQISVHRAMTRAVLDAALSQ